MVYFSLIEAKFLGMKNWKTLKTRHEMFVSNNHGALLGSVSVAAIHASAASCSVE